LEQVSFSTQVLFIFSFFNANHPALKGEVVVEKDTARGLFWINGTDGAIVTVGMS